MNTKPVRLNAMDGAVFPHIIKVEYTVDGQNCTVREWLGAGCPVPAVGSLITVRYDEDKPSEAKAL